MRDVPRLQSVSCVPLPLPVTSNWVRAPGQECSYIYDRISLVSQCACLATSLPRVGFKPSHALSGEQLPAYGVLLSGPSAYHGTLKTLQARPNSGLSLCYTYPWLVVLAVYMSLLKCVILLGASNRALLCNQAGSATGPRAASFAERSHGCQGHHPAVCHGVLQGLPQH
jgi:hypothetical protein